MEEHELWLSEEEDEEEEEDLSDPSSITMPLTYQGPPGEFRTTNRPGEVQRPHVSVYQAGRRKKPAFTVSCNAKAMIHGALGGSSSKRATLLVYEFQFRSYRGARLKGADILFEFKPQPGATGNISVAKVRPDGVHKMEKTEQSDGTTKHVGLGGGFTDAVQLETSVDHSSEKVTKYHTVVTGDRPQEIWGGYYEARFSLSENASQEDGIPSKLTACILLERDDDYDFVCIPTISVQPDFRTTVATLLSTRDRDDPVYFSVDEDPYDLLEGRTKIDPGNLGATDLDELWDCTMHHDYSRAIKPSKPVKVD